MDRRESGFNGVQFHQLEIAVRAEVAEKLDGVISRLHDGDERMKSADDRMERFEAALKVNTDATMRMLAVFEAAERGLKIFGAIGSSIAWVIRKGWPMWAPLAAAYAWWRGVPPPNHHP